MAFDYEFRVTHITHDMDKLSGGIPAVIRQLSRNLHGSYSTISHSVIFAEGVAEVTSGIDDILKISPSKWASAWKYSDGMSEKIRSRFVKYRSNGNPLIVHLHGVWSAPQYYGARLADNMNLPFLVSSHGMLEPWLWNEQGLRMRFKKNLYWQLLARRVLNQATVLHAITALEKKHLQALFPEKKTVLIPNAINVLPRSSSSIKRKRELLYLGRIEPKKGLHLLLTALAESNITKDWVLNVAGPFWSDAYERYIMKIVRKRNLIKRVNFLGHVFGNEKSKLLNESWVMCVPSYSEVIGLVNLEAAACCLPSITTYQTGLCDWEDGGGILIDPTVQDLKVALQTVCSWSENEQLARGDSSYKLVNDRYSWPSVIPQWLDLYKSMADECRK
jgi:glycosyltransferase involved in cell wall biosynthesis